MKSNIIFFNYLLSLIALFSKFSITSSVLSFTFPQATTLGNKYILIVEKNGIYICDPSYSNLVSTLLEFSDEDKIIDVDKLSKTIIKKSSIFILILSNFKLYVIETKTGSLLKKTTSKLVEDDDNIDYVTLAYSYLYKSAKFYFELAYLDKSSNFHIKYYDINYNEYTNYCTVNSINYYNTLNGNSVTRTINGNSYEFVIQDKGLSCDNVEATDSDLDDPTSYIVCFLIAKSGDKDFLIPLAFDDTSEGIVSVSSAFTIPYININK